MTDTPSWGGYSPAFEDQMTVGEMKERIDRIEKMAKLGFLSASEAEQRISQLIDETLPEEAILDEEIWKRMEQRRLAERRKWRFLLTMTKSSCEVI